MLSVFSCSGEYEQKYEDSLRRIAQLEEELAQSKQQTSEVTRLRDELGQWQNYYSQCTESYEAQLLTIREENNALTQKYEALKAENDNSQCTQSYEAQLSTIREEINALTQKHETLKAEIDRLQYALCIRGTEIDRLQYALYIRDTDIDELTGRLMASRDYIYQLKNPKDKKLVSILKNKPKKTVRFASKNYIYQLKDPKEKELVSIPK